MKFFQLHPWPQSVKEAIQLQQTLAEQVAITALKKPIRLVAGVDVSYCKHTQKVYAAVVVIECATQQVIETAFHSEKASFPYVSGLLAFREIPPLLKAFEKLQSLPDAVLCDGQGIAHPRRMGLAAHLGLWLQIPTVGCAKTRLVGEYAPFALEKGAQETLQYKGKGVGVVLCTKKGVKPLFVSPGHLINTEESVKLVKSCIVRWRLPEPTRQAHLATNRLRLSEAETL